MEKGEGLVIAESKKRLERILVVVFFFFIMGEEKGGGDVAAHAPRLKKPQGQGQGQRAQ